MSDKLYTFYDFLKDLYGIIETEEIINKEDSTIKRVLQVDIPGFIKSNEKHIWTIHLEKFDNGTFSLILGQRYSNDITVWSRFAEFKKEKNSSKIFFTIKDSMFFEPEFSFQNLKVLLAIIEKFHNR